MLPLRSLTYVTKDEMKKTRGDPGGAKDCREIKRTIKTEMEMAKETWIQDQCQEVEACIRKNNSKKAYQLVKDLTTGQIYNHTRQVGEVSHIGERSP